ncbi:cation channel sperm-associated protein 2 isoform X2 [Folsomia candida]|nr:cation channel sperm-associated protein 2 isoform X2 [Folsomia candida]
MIFITALMAIFFYIFAIIGIQVFDRYTHSHRANLDYRKSFSGLPNSFVTLFQLFTLDHWYDLLRETSDVMKGWTVPCIYILSWILLGSFIFRNIFVGVMVNNFQNIRQNMMTEQKQDHQNRKLAQLNIFALDELEMEHIESDDPLVDWEAEVFHNLEIIKALGQKMSPVMWPRDTMFQYYMLLEAYASNADERNQLFKLLDKALLRFLDS